MQDSTSQRTSELCNLTYIFTLDAYGTPEGQIVFATASALLVAFVVASNATIIHLTRTSPELKSLGPLRLFIGSMACADLLTGLVPMPAAAHQYIHKEWKFGYGGCKLFLTFGTLTATASALHLCAIAVDCYVAVLHPVIHKRLESSKCYSNGIITAVWVVSAGISAPVYTLDLPRFWESNSKQHCECPCPQHAPLSTAVFLLLFAIPSGLVVFAYSHIYCVSREKLHVRMSTAVRSYQVVRAHTARPASGSDAVANDDGGSICMARFMPTSPCLGCHGKVATLALKSGLCQVCRAPNDLMTAAFEARMKALLNKKKKSLAITMTIMGLFLFCFMPTGTRNQIAAFCPNCQLDCSFTIAIAWLFYANSALNPIVYTVFNAKFRKAFKRLIVC